MLPYQPTSPTPPDHLLGVLRTLWRWRKPIVLTTLAGAILAVIISLLLPVFYTGFTSFVALSPEQNSLESTFGNGGQRIQFYGTGDDIDRMLSIAESNEVIEFMVDTFNLYSVYGIDSINRKGQVRVAQEFLSRYEVLRNPRDVIELSVEDKDPERAAAMARAARERIDQINLALIRSTHRRNATGLQREVAEGQRRLDLLNDRLTQIRQESGVYNTEAQSETIATSASLLSQQVARTEARLQEFRARGIQDSITKLTVNLAGLLRTQEAVNEQLEKLNSSIGSIENMEEERLQANESLSESRTRLKQFETILGDDRRTLEVIEEATVPMVKSSPIRWLIVVVATTITFLLSLLAVLLIDAGRRYDWDRITRG